jgi:hypothetical protein
MPFVWMHCILMYICPIQRSFAYGPMRRQIIIVMVDKLMNTIYSFGAAFVIFGAWGKIEHKEFGSDALTAGLLTETALFFVYGLLEWRKRPQHQPDSKREEADPAKVEELTATLNKTNRLMNKVFKTD